MEIDSQNQKLNVTFLPYPTPGHMIPMINTARIFAKNGVNVTIITTNSNALTFQKSIDNDFNHGYSIKTHLIQFLAAQVNLPNGIENLKDATSVETLGQISHGIALLQDQIELVIQDLQPDCIVTDMCYPWTVEFAAKIGIPRIYFYSSSYFSTCASYLIQKHRPHEKLVSNTEKFSIPGFQENIEMIPLQLAEWIRTKTNYSCYFEALFESELRSYGALYNSFDELESDYEQLYKSTIGIKTWSIGPVAMFVNKDDGEKANRGHNKELEKEPDWLNWLNSQQDDSVLYVSFGSLARLPRAQLVEIAHGLENSGHNFIWVVRKKVEENDESLIKDFEHRMKESKKGYIIWNWAPQVLILDHPAIGGIVTHCGWNSILESLNSGLPMITWPMFAEQFYNEKLLVDVLKIGISIGVKENKFFMSMSEEATMTRKEIANAVKILMGSGEGSIEMRSRAKKLGDAAKKTIEEGGSSYNNLMKLIDELKLLKKTRELSKKLIR
ncbi:hypothetical protein TanjilG_19263 [Lupinus angustifolius]|uniref:Glycosyltransferase n=1 Tax=Lupinus angustifolius TaxID=3871 RepID=A0A1J7H3V6_LUPAN|nr:PREDICTED: soyasapogenol B glucuronide galactosyltransferase-like [Lupinus angustifolius]OIW07422.1 hypothetical protein TanjilG_19263 [Lupinus angustifolius]